MSKLRVLWVEVEPVERERVSTLLTQADHTVYCASGLEEAAEALELEQFDAVLLGENFPESAVKDFAARRHQFARGRTSSPILSLAPRIAGGQEWSAAEGAGVDGYLLSQFSAENFADAIYQLSQASPASGGHEEQRRVFAPEEFREQCLDDPELMAEIIDLFLAEQEGQMESMGRALEGREFGQLARAAHTIKGSFAALHADRARHHTQALEAAAKNSQAEECRSALHAVAEDLTKLRPILIAFRDENPAK